jgi:carbonic anhydrase
MGLSSEAARPSADEALDRLIDGNQRFLRGEARSVAFRRETLVELAKAQRPYATILGCSDSRVPPEWIFDAGLGELFVVRIYSHRRSRGACSTRGPICRRRWSWC